MSDWDNLDDALTMLYIAEPGVGKSTAVTTLARRTKVAFIDAESGLRKRTLLRAGIDPENVKALKPRNTAGLYAVVTHIAEGGYGAVIVDSATEIQELVLTELRTQSPHAKQADLYMAANVIQKDWYRQLRDLGLPLAITATVRRDVDDEGAAINPKLSPGVGTDLRAMADLVVYMEQKENPHASEGLDRLGIVRTVGALRGKDRLGLVPGGVLADPTAERFVQLLNDELDLDTDPAMTAMRKRLANQ